MKRAALNAGAVGVMAFDAAAPFTKYPYPGIWVKDFDYARAAASGLSRLFTTSTGVTAVSAATQNVGFLIEESQGAAIGATVLADDFGYADVTALLAAGWIGYVNSSVDSSGLSIVSGSLRTTNPVGFDYARATRAITCVVGRGYRVTAVNKTVVGSTLEGVAVQVGTAAVGSGTMNIALASADQTIFGYFIATSTSQFITIGMNSGVDNKASDWDSIVIEEVLGNHLRQATSGQRGTIQDISGTEVWRGDAADDNLLAALSPAVGTTMFLRVKVTAGGVYIAGTQASASTRFQLTCNATTGQLGAAVGSVGNTTITGGGDIQNVEGVAVLRADGSRVTLWWYPVGGALTQLYDGAQTGAPTTTIPFRFGAFNNNGSVGTAPLSGDIYKILVLQAAMNDDDVATMAAAMAA